MGPTFCSTRIAAAASVALVLSACSTADIEGTRINSRPNKSNAQSKGPTCSDDAVELESADPETLPKCACGSGGTARCVPKEKVPGVVADQLEACSEGGPGVCVPDKLVASGGGAPTTCKSPFGEGRCMNLCVPEVAKNAALLNRGEGDACDEDERCVPCLNPLKNNEPTGVCEIGKPVPACDESGGGGGAPAPGPGVSCPYTGPPIVDVTTFPSCGDGARCVPSNLVPGEQASKLKTCEGGLCAPEKSIAAGGQHLPKTCTAVAGAEGRCLNVNLPDIEAQRSLLSRDVCDANELCAPCFNPIDGKETGACKSVSCDQPSKPAKTFNACCTSQGATRAKCVPSTMVPESQRGNLDDDDGTCVEGVELCVPNEMLVPGFKGSPCEGSTFLSGDYTGVCLSDCLHFSFIQKLGISRGNCMQGFKCAPCTNPLTGQPTGAPGCPGT